MDPTSALAILGYVWAALHLCGAPGIPCGTLLHRDVPAVVRDGIFTAEEWCEAEGGTEQERMACVKRLSK